MQGEIHQQAERDEAEHQGVPSIESPGHGQERQGHEQVILVCPNRDHEPADHQHADE